jgi:hypothetical protein
MSQHVKTGRVEVRRRLFVIFQLSPESVSRVLESIDLIEPERLTVKGVESQGKTSQEQKG